MGGKEVERIKWFIILRCLVKKVRRKELMVMWDGTRVVFYVI